MKRFRSLLMLVIGLSGYFATAQISNIQGRPNSILMESESKMQIVGSRYLYKGFKNAQVYSHSGEVGTTLIRFDKVNNEFEVYREGGGLLITKYLYPQIRIEFYDDELAKKQVFNFKNNFKVQGFQKHHYFEVLDESDGNLVLKDHFTKQIDTEVSEYGGDDFIRREFKTAVKYYYVRGDLTFEIKNKKGSILSLFKSKEDDLKTFIKSNKIKFDSDESLVKVLKFINTLEL